MLPVNRATACVALGAAATFSLGVHALLTRPPAPRPLPAVVPVAAAGQVRPAASAPRPRRSRALPPPPSRPALRRPAAPPRPRPAPPPSRPAPVARAPRPVPPAPAGPTTWAELNRVIARLPSYRPGVVTWVVFAHDGYWGTVDWATSTVFIGPQVPLRRLYDVVVHEWSHVLSLRAYGGDVDAATAGMNAHFGGTGITGAERAADCMAVVAGATWTNYTPCHDARWRAGAARLLRGQRP